MEQEEAIEIKLDRVKELAWKYKVRLLGVVVTATVVAAILGFVMPNKYESTSLIQAKSQKTSVSSMQAAAAASLLGGAAQSPSQGYSELMKSNSVLAPIIAKMDLPAATKEKLNNEAFAKKYLKIEVIKGTNLIAVTGVGRTPEEAQWISNSTVNNLETLLTRLNQSDQTLMMKFLNDRIQVTKKELDGAEQNLEKFRQQKNIFQPDAQTKAMLEKITLADQKIAETTVGIQANQAKLAGIDQQLAAQNMAVSRYQVADQPEIQQIRTSITKKQMDLLALQQRYTDKHPDVMAAKQEIAGLEEKLRQVADQAVEAGTTTLNPVQSGLLKQKVETETQLLAGQAELDGMRTLQDSSEADIKKLSAESVTYVGLARNAAVAQEVYTSLVKSYEQARIQEAMESMDIQIVDTADLPKKPVGSGVLLLTIVGGGLGVVVCLIALLVLSGRKVDSGRPV